ncbi:TonB-dependent receptor [Thalassotalea sp. 42_200_T64]|nr:TonB-dependent receptor [Thalassotalea sp. 42_200_T64]
MKFHTTALCSAITIGLISQSAIAEQQATQAATKVTENHIEVIEVVGDFRNQSLQRTASALSVITEDDIAVRNAQNLEEIILATPNVNFSSGSNRARYYQIRGIGERSQFQEPINPSVGMVIDDVDFTGIGSVASMFDVQQVEVFRGPQGTRFGANAMAGVVNITTKAPSDEFEGEFKLMAGNYNSIAMGAVISGPASDNLAYRFAVEQFTSDGFVENTHLNTDDTNNRDELTIRSKFSYQPSDDLSIDLAVFYFDFDNGYDTFSLDNNRETRSDQPGFDTQETIASSVRVSYKGLDFIDVLSIFSYADSDMGYGYDEDWAYGEYQWLPDEPVYTPDPCITPTGCLADFDGYSSIDHYFRDRSSFTGELRLLSKPGHNIFDNSTVWVAGVYLRNEENDLLRQYTYAAGDFNSTYETDTVAGFVQLDSKLSDKMTLTTGLRVEQWQLSYLDSQSLSFDPDETLFGGKLVLAYQASEDTMYYGSINRGFKAGGVNTDGTLARDKREFDAEYLWNYEVGVKSNFLDNSAHIRAAAFYMDREDMQVKTYEDYTRPDGTPGFLIYLDNAASGSNQGIEIDGSWAITDSVEIYGALGLLDSEYKDFINGNGEDFSGQEQAHAPNYQFNLGVNYQPVDNWLFNVSVDGKDEFYFSDSHRDKSDAVELLNASVTYLRDNWQIKAWGRNITDEDYQTRGFYFGNDPRDGYTAKGYYQLGAPAEFGVTFNYHF